MWKAVDKRSLHVKTGNVGNSLLFCTILCILSITWLGEWCAYCLVKLQGGVLGWELLFTGRCSCMRSPSGCWEGRAVWWLLTGLSSRNAWKRCPRRHLHPSSAGSHQIPGLCWPGPGWASGRTEDLWIHQSSVLDHCQLKQSGTGWPVCWWPSPGLNNFGIQLDSETDAQCGKIISSLLARPHAWKGPGWRWGALLMLWLSLVWGVCGDVSKPPDPSWNRAHLIYHAITINIY